MIDQAEKLRKIIMSKNKINESNKSNGFKVITIASGKGGVGKSNITLNVALELQKKGLRVAILDADLGMANIDILLGVNSKYNIYHLIKGTKGIDEIMIETNYGIKIIPGGSGINELCELDEVKRNRIINEFGKIDNIDVLLIDTGAGASNNVLEFLKAADDVIVVTNSEPTSIADAYGLIKIMINNDINKNIGIIINRAKNLVDGLETYNNFNKAVNVFLKRDIKYVGYLVEDSKVRQCVMEQIPFIYKYPNSQLTLCIQRIANVIIGEKEQNRNSSIKDYFKRLFMFREG